MQPGESGVGGPYTVSVVASTPAPPPPTSPTTTANSSASSSIKKLVSVFLFFTAVIGCSFVIINNLSVISSARELKERHHAKAVDTHTKKDHISSLFSLPSSSSVDHNQNNQGKSSAATTSFDNQHNNDADQKNRQILPLHIDVPAVGSSTCPLPVLHPEKFAPMMHWGERKKFPSCRFPHHDGGNFSRIERRKKGNDYYKETLDQVVVVVNTKRCPMDHAVFEFGELSDTDFTRMTSTYDAEQRQNALKEKYRDPHQFAKRVMPYEGDTEGVPHEREFYLSKPYAVVECAGDRALHITAPTSLNDKGGVHHSSPITKKRHGGNKKKFQKQQKHHHHSFFDPNEAFRKRGSPHDPPSWKGVADSDKEQFINRFAFQNVLHFMWDSTSLPAFRRGAKKTRKFLEKLHNTDLNSNNDNNRNAAASSKSSKLSSPSYVFHFKHYHSVSCCSPGNQIPVYSGNMNGEGDYFVNSEPYPDSTDWLWNIARDELGFKTFWSLDNCPDKSARDYHAFPTVDSRVVAPICLAGVLLSHKERTCVGGKSVDEHVLDGLQDWWQLNKKERKFAAIQFITPHEESEKQLIEVDDLVATWFEKQVVFTPEELSKTLIVLWSDHGINFGKYASTHDGEVEKMFPFVFLITPRPPQVPKSVLLNLQSFTEHLVTPYDMFATVRSLMFLKKTSNPIDSLWAKPSSPLPMPPDFEHDSENPPLPQPSESHIMASFQKEIVPIDMAMNHAEQVHSQRQEDRHRRRRQNESNNNHLAKLEDRTCDEANIPIEFCSCLAWHLVQHDEKDSASSSSSLRSFFDFIARKVLVKEHARLLSNFSEKCRPVAFDSIESVYVQVWPIEYKPKQKETAKRVWMKPNRDFVKITYRNKAQAEEQRGGGVFVGVVSISQGLLKLGTADANHHGGEKKNVVVATNTLDSLMKKKSGGGSGVVAAAEKKQRDAVLDVVRLDRVDAMTKKCDIVQKVPEQLCICL